MTTTSINNERLVETNNAAPVQYLRRSQLYRQHIEAGALFEDINGTLTVASYPNAFSNIEVEQQQAIHLGLTDLSTAARVGFKGRGAGDWIQQQTNAQLPDAANRANRQDQGSLVAKLSQEEYLILSDLSLTSKLTDTLKNNWSLDTAKDTYLLPRSDSHCWLALTGRHATETLAKVCGVDMRTHKFNDGDIAQTSLARVNAIIIRHDLGKTPCFYILSDSSSTEFLWTCLLDAMREFEGSPVGTAALQTLSITL
jgi:sarcosine oxidase, subunit gamma